MELSKNFEHSAAEEKWYRHWLDKKYFHSEPDNREPYTIVIPPPNVTGVLHMGHCLNNTIQDILVRRARMQGKNACWVPGTDHASIATEAKVVQMLRERGISKSSLGRDEFLGYAWEWKEKYGGIILQQLKKLGCSLDWDRTTFTMDPDYYSSVINVFIDLYNKGCIYRGKRMINWDPIAKTALSDEEVIRKETNQKLYYLKYLIDKSEDRGPQSADESGNSESTHGSQHEARSFITIATVRPETIMGDTAICVHPNDERYKHLHGKFAFVPLINRRIPIITDEYVSVEFGTGALKVTPAHDMNDNMLGQKHNLEVVDIFNEDGTLNEEAQIYIGEDRFEARKKIVKELEEKGFLLKTEDYTSEVGHSERTDTVVEPRLSLQWWVDMKKISGPALKAVMEEDIKFYPAKFKNLYRHWMENIKDWCISRQLWWGHRIPAWYDAEGRFVVAATEDEAKKMFKSQFALSDVQLKQDEDCLDTWFSSWLWPFEVFKGYSDPGNKEVEYYYPTNTLVTAPEIIFFWVARMIMAGFEYKKEKPFSEVYFTGIVRDKVGRKMSKQLGNSPDLLEMIDKDGADAVRFGIMISSPAGNDLMWDQSGNEQGKFFINKIWNALKLVKMWEKRQAANDELRAASFAVDWFESRLHEVRLQVDEQFKDFRLSESLKTIYSLIWDDFCSWYLEWVKPGFEQPIDKAVYEKTIGYFEQLMQMLHPFLPFITEEVYHQLQSRENGDDICIKLDTNQRSLDRQILNEGALAKKLIEYIRNIRAINRLKSEAKIDIFIKVPKEKTNSFFKIKSLVEYQTSAIFSQGQPATTQSNMTTEFIEDFEIKAEKIIDKDSLFKELLHYLTFMNQLENKLSNENFLKKAKDEIITLEYKKIDDARFKFHTLYKNAKLFYSNEDQVLCSNLTKFQDELTNVKLSTQIDKIYFHSDILNKEFATFRNLFAHNIAFDKIPFRKVVARVEDKPIELIESFFGSDNLPSSFYSENFTVEFKKIYKEIKKQNFRLVKETELAKITQEIFEFFSLIKSDTLNFTTFLNMSAPNLFVPLSQKLIDNSLKTKYLESTSSNTSSYLEFYHNAQKKFKDIYLEKEDMPFTTLIGIYMEDKGNF